jgi:phosphoribosylanthranilate isomerase
MNTLQIKVCGMREENNITAVSELPIDYIGFIFYEKSPRYLNKTLQEFGTLGELLKNIKQKKVGVFVNADIDFIYSKVIDYQLDILQLHGKETVEFINKIKNQSPTLNPQPSIWKAFSVDENFDFKTTEPYAGLVDMFLFDTKSSQHGGAGVKFDWDILKKYTGKTPFMLAGGINENDADLIRNLKSEIRNLMGVDLNSRFEIEPAFKDVNKLKKLINGLLSN